MSEETKAPEKKAAKKVFVNPFTPGEMVDTGEKDSEGNPILEFKAGPSIDDFTNSVGSQSVADYLKGEIKGEENGELIEFDEHDIKWLESEIKKHAYNQKNKAKFLQEAHIAHKHLVTNNNKNLEQ